METEISFEDALEQLEGAVSALEGGELGLDDALARYEQGIRLLVHCRSLLESAEKKVALLTGVDPDGAPTTAPFDAAAVEKDPKVRASEDGRSRSKTRRSARPADDIDPPF
jgi:exodeoxyribonuclease VII small subunit